MSSCPAIDCPQMAALEDRFVELGAKVDSIAGVSTRALDLLESEQRHRDAEREAAESTASRRDRIISEACSVAGAIGDGLLSAFRSWTGLTLAGGVLALGLAVLVGTCALAGYSVVSLSTDGFSAGSDSDYAEDVNGGRDSEL